MMLLGRMWTDWDVYETTKDDDKEQETGKKTPREDAALNVWELLLCIVMDDE